MDLIPNKIAESGLITFDLSDLLNPSECITFDLAPFLYEGFILQEKPFRAALKTYDWNPFVDKFVNIDCTTDAIIPDWAYMLVSTYLTQSKNVLVGNKSQNQQAYINSKIATLDLQPYTNQRIIIKGCSSTPISKDNYVQITHKLQGVAKSVFYGEACSSVPLYKK